MAHVCHPTRGKMRQGHQFKFSLDYTARLHSNYSRLEKPKEAQNYATCISECDISPERKKGHSLSCGAGELESSNMRSSSPDLGIFEVETKIT